MDHVMTPLDEFTAELDPGARATVERLAAAITGAGVSLDPAIKWGRLTYALDGDFHHWLCGIGVTRKGATLQFHFGRLLPDPDGRLRTGASRFLGALDYPAAEAVDAEVVGSFVRAAVERLPFFKANWKAIGAGTVDPLSPGAPPRS